MGYNIRDFLADTGTPHAGEEHNHGRPGWVQVDCPRCGAGGVGKYHLGISLTTGAAACWRCGKQNTAKALADLTGSPVAKMRAILDGADTTAPKRRRTGTLRLPDGVGPMATAHKAYLRRRGLDPVQVARLWGVKGLGPGARMGNTPLDWRLFIPIQLDGETVSWTTRAIAPKARLRYVSAGADQEALSHKALLYGSDYAATSVIVHEGPIDVWATGPGAVALCGLGYTDAQVAAIARYAIRVVCFDGSPAAQRRGAALAKLLAPYPGQTYQVRLTTGEDAAAADRSEIEELRSRFL